MSRFFAAIGVIALISFSAFSQETRSTLAGRVLDPNGGAIVGATVVVRNTDTGVALNFSTNDTGYYQATLLLPGTYEVSAEAAGFKKLMRKGVVLQVSS